MGSIAVDYTCDVIPPSNTSSNLWKPQLSTSNPAKITETIGGVAHNVFTASHLYLKPSNHVTYNAKVRLVSAVGSDIAGRWIVENLTKRGIDVSGIDITPEESGMSTARYIAMNDSQGGLFTASADMAIAENMRKEHTIAEVKRAMPSWICIDGNLSREAITDILRVAKEVDSKGIILTSTSPTSSYS